MLVYYHGSIAIIGFNFSLERNTINPPPMIIYFYAIINHYLMSLLCSHNVTHTGE